jgi:hypothetical protein
MQRRTAFRVASGLICIASAAAGAAGVPSPVAPPEGPALTPRTHEFMLYLTKPLGGGGASLRPKFGFRVDQVRMTSNTGALEGADDPLQHHPLIGWQMDGRADMRVSDMKVDLGGRMTYDVTRGAFGPPVAKSPVPRETSADRNLISPASNLFGTSSSESNSTAKDPYLATHGFSSASSSTVRDIAAAAIATFKSSRSNAVQQRVELEERSVRDGGRSTGHFPPGGMW